MKQLICVLILLLTIKSSVAQIINIEEKRYKNAEEGLQGNIDINFKFTQNTKSVWQVSNNISLLYRKKKLTHLFLNNITLVRSNNSDLVNYGYAHYRLIHMLSDVRFIKWESYSQIQYNSVQKIKQRILVGSGLRFKIVNKDSLQFNYGWSLMYEYEETTIPEFSNVVRNSNYLSLDWKISKLWEFKTIVYYQPSISDFSDFRLSNESTISHKLTDHFSIVARIKFLYDSAPPLEVPVNNFNTSLLLRYKI
jgi:putative salt-induced outer membrane protein YdiY